MSCTRLAIPSLVISHLLNVMHRRNCCPEEDSAQFKGGGYSKYGHPRNCFAEGVTPPEYCPVVFPSGSHMKTLRRYSHGKLLNDGVRVPGSGFAQVPR